METVGEKKSQRKLISATMFIITALIIVIAANGVVWKNRLARSAEINALSTQLAQVSGNITKAPAPPADLEARLAHAKAGLAAAQAVLPPQFNRNDAIDYMIALAKECGVEILPVVSQGWTMEKAGLPYPVLKLSSTVTGSFNRVNNYIYRLQNGKYETLAVPEIAITRNSPPDSAGTFSGDSTIITARVSISVYAGPQPAAKGVK